MFQVHFHPSLNFLHLLIRIRVAFAFKSISNQLFILCAKQKLPNTHAVTKEKVTKYFLNSVLKSSIPKVKTTIVFSKACLWKGFFKHLNEMVFFLTRRLHVPSVQWELFILKRRRWSRSCSCGAHIDWRADRRRSMHRLPSTGGEVKELIRKV